MAGKISDISAQRNKHRRNGWTIAEIEKGPAEEAKQLRRLGVDEPDAAASGGDMSKLTENQEEMDD